MARAHSVLHAIGCARRVILLLVGRVGDASGGPMVRQMYDALLRSRATLTLMGIIVLAYLVEVVSPELVLDSTAQTGVLVAGGEYHRLLTSAFVHLPPPGIYHVLLNLVCLAVLGPFVESLLGRAWFIVVFLLSMLGASVLSYAFVDPQASAVGASGGVYGLVGVVAVLRPRDHRTWTVAVLVLSVPGMFPIPQIDWLAHVGGAVTGALLGAALLHVRQRSRAIAGLAVGLGVVAAGGWIVDTRSASLVEQLSGLPGTYAMLLTPTSCTGFEPCPHDPVDGEMTISDCDGARCTITGFGWAAPVPLTRAPTGEWRAAGASAPEFSVACEGQPPVPTAAVVELSGVAFADGVSTVRGTFRHESTATASCAAAGTSNWEITGTR